MCLWQRVGVVRRTGIALARSLQDAFEFIYYEPQTLLMKGLLFKFTYEDKSVTIMALQRLAASGSVIIRHQLLVPLALESQNSSRTPQLRNNTRQQARLYAAGVCLQGELSWTCNVAIFCMGFRAYASGVLVAGGPFMEK